MQLQTCGSAKCFNCFFSYFHFQIAVSPPPPSAFKLLVCTWFEHNCMNHLFPCRQWRSQVPAFGGARCERSEQTWGSGGLPPEKLLETTPLRRSENEGNALFSYVLHHKPDYIEQKIGWMFCSIWIKDLCSL